VFSTHIPYDIDGDLGSEYNRIMYQNGDWTLFVDHDIFLCHPHWHSMLSEIIRMRPNAGLVTCYTNRIGKTQQKHPNAPQNDDIVAHRKFAKELFEMNHYRVMPISRASGMLMLVNKKAWEKVGGFEPGFFGVDWGYSKKLQKAGYEILLATGLYVYHLYNRTEGPWIEGEKVSKSFIK